MVVEIQFYSVLSLRSSTIVLFLVCCGRVIFVMFYRSGYLGRLDLLTILMQKDCEARFSEKGSFG